MPGVRQGAYGISFAHRQWRLPFGARGQAMFRTLFAALAVACLAAPAAAAVKPFPPSFKVRDMRLENATLHVRVGGHGPAVLMLHGFGDSGDMWQPLATVMAHDHTVIVPDLQGMGLSSHPDRNYDKKSQAADLLRMLDRLHVGKIQLVTHDIGNMVGYALAAQQPDRVTRWVVMDAPLPGLGHWDDQLKNPKTWHFNFHGPDEERLVKGRERIFLDRFYNELGANPKHIDEATRRHYAALYARPHAMHDALEQFVNFPKDGVDNQAFVAKGKLTMPVLAIGGSASYGRNLATEIGFAADNVQAEVIEDSGHWLMEEQPTATTAAILRFLNQP